MEYWKREYLAHHGILGMKWGKRNGPPYPLSASDHSAAEKKAGWRKSLDAKPTKKEMKKAIKTAKRKYRKSTGGFLGGKWGTTGENVADVDRKKREAIENDETLKSVSRRMRKVSSQIDEQQRKVNEQAAKTARRKDYMQRVQNDPNSSRDVRKEAEREYIKEKEWTTKKEDRLAYLDDLYDSLDTKYYMDSKKITNSFIEDYKRAVVKDLGYKDIEQGVKYLEDYGLVQYALNLKGLDL